eukprot:gene5858-9686_t
MGNKPNASSGENKHKHPDVTDDEKAKIVFEKLKNSLYANRFDDEELLDVANDLCTSKGLMDTYLSTNWTETLKMHEGMKKKENQKKKSGINLISSSGNEDTDLLKSEPEETGEDEEMTKEDLEQAKFNPDVQFKDALKVKLVIAEIATSTSKKAQRKALGPILNTLHLSPKLGLFHSALLIGPWLIEWNNSAICIPRKCVSNAAIITADLDTLKTTKEVEKTVSILADVISEYNCFHTYSKLTSGKPNCSNCQDFVEDILTRLDIELKFDGPLGNYLKTLKDKGTSDLIFAPDKNFIEKFSLKSSSVKFVSHNSLDEFVRDLMKSEPEFQKVHKQEYALLKSFDRAFWLRHFKFPNRTEYLYFKKDPEEEDDITGVDDGTDCGCPFLDPRTTNSVKFLNQ